MIRFLLLLVVLASFRVYAQEQASRTWEFVAPLASERSIDSADLKKTSTWLEHKEERTYFSKFFADENGQTRQIFSSVPLHYAGPNGELLPYDLSFRQSANYSIFENQEHPICLYNDASFALNFSQEEQLRIGRNTRINGDYVTKEMGPVGPYVSIRFEEQPVIQQLEVGNGKIGFHYRIPEPLATNDSLFWIEEQLDLPVNWTLSEPTSPQSGQRYIRDAKGTNRAVLSEILCYDASGSTYATVFEVVDQALRIQIPTAWINDPQRVFPITIDPLLAGIPSIWSGGQMPSCFMPAYNEDSIQVTIPAGITPTGVYVDASFYANPFTFATMSQGSMYFSSTCGASQTFTVTGPTANSAGTAYLDSFNLMNPLVCCLQKSCNPIQFWVSMHLGRNANGPGCNTNYIRYDPLTTSWPFQVIVYGRSPESYGNEWYTSQTPICSNQCEVSATAYARYGVPPYTFSHPWTATVGTAGQNMGCNSGASNYVFTLDVPNCPVYCDSSYTSLSIPPPVIVDACGTYITGLQNANKPLTAAIEPQLIYDSIICNGAAIVIQNEPCISDGVTMFIDQNNTGFGSINTLILNNTDSTITQVYQFVAERLGCLSDTVQAAVQIVPLPNANITMNPNPVVVSNPVIISNASVSLSGTNLSGYWSFADTLIYQDTLVNLYDVPGNISFCLYVSDGFGCTDSTCAVLTVVPADIENINIITPNTDGINDALYFQYLDFYPNAHLVVLNRWGQTVYESLDYKNDWKGGDLVEGTYFYKLIIPDLNKTLQSFFKLER